MLQVNRDVKSVFFVMDLGRHRVMESEFQQRSQ